MWKEIDEIRGILLSGEELEKFNEKLLEKRNWIILPAIENDGRISQYYIHEPQVETYLKISYLKFTFIDLSPLVHCPNLRELHLNGNALETLDLKPLSSCNSLEELNLSENKLKSIDLTPLSNCRYLKYLKIDRNSLNSIDLSPLSSCTNLRDFTLNRNSLTSIDLSPLKDCEDLDIITLGNNSLTSLDLSPIIEHKEFEGINLDNNRLNSIDLELLASAKNLRFVSCCYNPLKEIDLSPLSKCKKLESLYLYGASLSEIDLSPLSNCQNFETLGLGENSLTTIDLTPLSSCKKLRSISLLKNKLTSIDLTPIQSGNEFNFLYLGNNPLKEVDLTPLINCTDLSGLEIDEEVELLWNSADNFGSLQDWPKGFEPHISKLEKARTDYRELQKEKRGDKPFSIKELQEQLSFKDWRIREEAIVKLGEIEEERSSSILCDHFEKETDINVKKILLLELAKKEDEKPLEIVFLAQFDNNEIIQTTAKEAIERIEVSLDKNILIKLKARLHKRMDSEKLNLVRKKKEEEHKEIQKTYKRFTGVEKEFIEAIIEKDLTKSSEDDPAAKKLAILIETKLERSGFGLFKLRDIAFIAGSIPSLMGDLVHEDEQIRSSSAELLLMMISSNIIDRPYLQKLGNQIGIDFEKALDSVKDYKHRISKNR